jgi:hypothetical protein
MSSSDIPLRVPFFYFRTLVAVLRMQISNFFFYFFYFLYGVHVLLIPLLFYGKRPFWHAYYDITCVLYQTSTETVRTGRSVVPILQQSTQPTQHYLLLTKFLGKI